MTSVIGAWTTADGTVLRTRTWASTAPDTEPLASVLLVHGLAEHSGRYEHVGEQLAEEGLEVHSFDLRGHGASSGRRIHLGTFDEFYRDLAERLADLRAAVIPRPIVLYGLSLGGLIALGYVLRAVPGRSLPDLLVLSAPGLDSTIPAWKVRLTPILGRLVPTLSVPNPIAGSLLSRDPSVGERYDADPLVMHSATAGFGAAAGAEQRWVRSNLASLTMPTLVIHGLDDGLVPPGASAPLGELTAVTRRTYPGIRHELHNEPEGPAVVADVVAWIKDQIAAR